MSHIGTVFSVLVEDRATSTKRFHGPWVERWEAEVWAEKNHTDCRRAVVEWQMLNVSWGQTYEPHGGASV